MRGGLCNIRRHLRCSGTPLTVEDLPRFDEAVARLTRLIRSRPLQLNEVWGPLPETELSSLIRGRTVYRMSGRLPSGCMPHRTHHLSAGNSFIVGPDGLLRGHFEARPEHWDEVRDHFTASPYLRPGPTPERLKAAVVQTMRQLLRGGDDPTRAAVAYHLPRRIGERWLRKLLKKHRLSWDEVRCEAEQDPPSSPGTK
jgi:hypothetical protein